ncbi:MAG: transcriptional repressor [Hyphomicrobiaceae bacterium]|nr:transcriptional repressor [Hyphomicrobiaceae bacterium]
MTRGGRNQQTVLSALQKAERPMTAYQILETVRDAGISAPLTVYRALERLQQDGQVHRLESLNAYLPCCQSHGCAPHQGRDAPVFVICERCGMAEEIVDAAVGNALRQLSETRGFRVAAVSIEVKGLCASCKNAAG